MKNSRVGMGCWVDGPGLLRPGRRMLGKGEAFDRAIELTSITTLHYGKSYIYS